MSESTATTVTQSSEAIKEIAEAADLYRKKKGKTPKGITEPQKQRWSDHVAAVLSDCDVTIEKVSGDLRALPPSVVANGAVKGWSGMQPDRRAAYLRWLATLEADRALGHKVILIPDLLEIAPEVSANLICNIPLNKEAKERLGVALISGAADKLSALFDNEPARYRLPDLLGRLFEFAEGPKVGVGERWRTIKLILQQIVKRNLLEDGLAEPVLRRVDAQLRTMPDAIKLEMKDLLKEPESEALLQRLFPGAAIRSSQANLATPEGSSETTRGDDLAHAGGGQTPTKEERSSEVLGAHAPLSSERLQVLQRLSDSIRSLRGQAETLSEIDDLLRNAAESADRSSHALRMKLDEVQGDLARAQDAQKAAEGKVQSLESEIRASNERETVAQRTLHDQELKARSEREELFRRVEGNAERRLEEFRNSLGSSLAQLLRGMPERGATVSGSTGGVVLGRVYQILDLLESKGIRVISSSHGEKDS